MLIPPSIDNPLYGLPPPKFKKKSWSLPSMIFQKSQPPLKIRERGSHYDFINKKDPILKEEFHTNYKKYGNLYSPPLRRKVNRLIMINILREIGIISRKRRKGIKSLIFLKTVVFSVSTVLSLDNGDTITETTKKA